MSHRGSFYTRDSFVCKAILIEKIMLLYWSYIQAGKKAGLFLRNWINVRHMGVLCGDSHALRGVCEGDRQGAEAASTRLDPL